MIQTDFGDHDGASWEALCQMVFKQKFLSDGYQAVEASPGDYGLEGITLHTGLAFQCYCPDKLYTSQKLTQKIRQKINDDLNKLKLYQSQVVTLLGDTKLKRWYFVTPGIPNKSLLSHARKKQNEVRAWGLPFIDSTFSVELHDGEFYANEIAAIQATSVGGISLDAATNIDPLEEDSDFYEKNLRRKSALRVSNKLSQDAAKKVANELYERSSQAFLKSDTDLQRISIRAPTVYYALCRLLNVFQQHVKDTSATWHGSPYDLTEKLRVELEDRVTKTLGPAFSQEVAMSITQDMVARWLAICSLDYA